MSDLCRLYLITPPKIDDLKSFGDAFARALDAGDVACVQLRLKEGDASAPDDEILRAAEILAPIARQRDVAFLINDSADLAKKSGADGVHIGQSDGSYAEARELLGPDAMIGVTCHASRHLALEAGEAGADYVAFGAFFETETKAASSIADPEILEWWTYATTVPAVAIGGITAENCGSLVRAGADFLAVSSGIWKYPDGTDAGVKAINEAIGTAASE